MTSDFPSAVSNHRSFQKEGENVGTSKDDVAEIFLNDDEINFIERFRDADESTQEAVRKVLDITTE